MKNFIISTFVVISLLLGGCVTIPISPRYQPSAQLKTHQGSPTHVDLQIWDERGDEAFYQGIKSSLYSLTPSLQQILADGFTEALQSQGHELRDDAEIKYNIAIKQFLVREQIIPGPQHIINAGIVLDVAVKRDDQILVKKTIIGKDSGKHGVALAFQPNKVNEMIEAILSRSISQAIENAIQDTDLSAAIGGTIGIGHENLIDAGTDVNVINNNGNTPLIIASGKGHTEIVKQLLEESADVNATRNTDGSTPLHIASENGHMEIVKLLLAAKADVNAVDKKYGAMPLFVASQNGHAETVKLLLTAKADVNATRKTDGVTPLQIAAQQGHTEVVRLLLAAKADVNVKDKTDGDTPLFMPSKSGHTEVVRLLLEAKADVNATRNTDGSTPLFLASKRGHAEVVRLLLEAKADVNVARTTDGVTALFFASQEGHTEVVRLLLEAKADVNVARTTDGVTPLHMASQNDHAETVKLLLDAQANVNAADKIDGSTPLHIASRQGHTEIVNLLKEYGANVPNEEKSITVAAPSDDTSANSLAKGQPAWSLSKQQNVLEPFRAIPRDKVLYSLGCQWIDGYAIPKSNADQLIVVFFKLRKDSLAVDDLNWIIKDPNDLSYRTIGFGIPRRDEPVVYCGKLTKGNLSSFTGGKELLVALIYILPKDITNLSLLDPQQNKDMLQLSADWLPGEENIVEAFANWGTKIEARAEDWDLIQK